MYGTLKKWWYWFGESTLGSSLHLAGDLQGAGIPISQRGSMNRIASRHFRLKSRTDSLPQQKWKHLGLSEHCIYSPLILLPSPTGEWELNPLLQLLWPWWKPVCITRKFLLVSLREGCLPPMSKKDFSGQRAPEMKLILNVYTTGAATCIFFCYQHFI